MTTTPNSPSVTLADLRPSSTGVDAHPIWDLAVSESASDHAIAIPDDLVTGWGLFQMYGRQAVCGSRMQVFNCGVHN